MIGVGVALILGFALAGAQLLPFAEVIRQNVRAGGSSFSDVPQWALPAKQLVALIIPDFFGNPTHHTFFDIISGQWASFAGSMDAAGQPRTYPFWGARNYVEAASYIGVLPLVLAIVALVRRSDRHSAFFGVYGLVALLMALGTPLYALIYFLVPGAEQLHSPFRWLFPLTFCLTVLAGRGADVLIRHAGTRLYRFGEVVGATLMVLGATILGALLISWLASGLTLSGVTLIRNMSAALQAAFPTVESLYSYELRNIALFGVLLAVSGATLSIALRPSPPLTRRPGEPPSETGGRASRSGPALLVGVVFVDLALFGWGYLPFSDAKLATFVPPSLQWLQERQREEGPFRIASFGTSKVLPPNTAMLAGLQDIRGYDSIIPKQYVEYWRLMEEPQTLQYTQIDAIREGGSLESPLFDLMNVRYIVADQVIATPGFTLVYQQEVYIYRNDNALPRAYIALNAISAATDAVARESLTSPDFNPRNAVVLQGANPAAKADVQPDTSPLPLGDAQGEGSTPIILDYTSNKVRIQANLSEPGYLVLSDAYFDGWQAFDASGNALPVLKANGAFRAVALPAGEHTVTFSYSPLSVRFGFLLSLLGVVGWLLLAGYWGWLHFRIERTSAVTVQRVVKNSVTPMAAQMLGRVVDLGFAVVMLRILGPTSYGAYAFAVVLIGYFGIMSDFGLGTLLTREVARDPSRVGAYLGNTLLVRGTLTLLSAPVLLGLLAVYYTYFSLPLEAVFATGLFFLSLVPSGIAGVLSAVFSAHEKMEYAAAMTIVTTLVRVAVGIVALAVGWGVVGLGVASLVASSTNAVAFVWLARHNFDLPQLRVELPFARSLLATSAPLMINNLLNTIFFRVDVLFLQSFLGTQAVGYYSTAYKFVDGLLLIPSFFTLALFPVFSRFAENSPDRLLYVYSTSVKGLLIIALPIALALTFLAEPLVALLFGPDYAPSARALQIVIWFLPFSYINGVTQYVLISLNQQRYLTGAFFIGTMFNVVANIVVIPTHGINGAALVTVLSEIVLLAPFMYGIHRHLGVGPLGQAAVRPFIAAAIVLLGLMAFQGQSPWVLAALGIGVYGTLLLVLGTFGKEDRALLGRLFARSGAAERIG